MPRSLSFSGTTGAVIAVAETCVPAAASRLLPDVIVTLLFPEI
jgi:hypothetical protein